MSYWPDDIRGDDILGPVKIMEEAASELEARTGVLTAIVLESKLPDRIVLSFVVRNSRADMEVKLFEASHRQNELYPIAISPPQNDFPDYLKKKVYVPGTLSGVGLAIRAVEGTSGRYVDNKWVSVTPMEFREKLKELFADEVIKSKIISLVAQPPTIPPVAQSVGG